MGAFESMDTAAVGALWGALAGAANYWPAFVAPVLVWLACVLLRRSAR